MKKMGAVFFVVLALMGFTVVSAQADLITGVVQFVGSATFDNPLPNATQVNSFANVLVQNGTQSGDYTGTDGSTVTYTQPFVFANSNTYYWSFEYNGKVYQFQGVGATTVSQGMLGTLPYLTVSGYGKANITGFDETDGVWSFTSQGNVSTLTFSAFTAVPEPSTLLLLGAGILGLGLSRGRVRRA